MNRDITVMFLSILIVIISAISVGTALENFRLQDENYSLKQEKAELLKENDAQNAEITRLRAHILGIGG